MSDITQEQIYEHCFYCRYYGRPGSEEAMVIRQYGLIPSMTHGVCGKGNNASSWFNSTGGNYTEYVDNLAEITLNHIAKCKLLGWRCISSTVAARLQILDNEPFNEP